MLLLAKILPYLQIAFAVILAVVVLLQQNEASLGAAFGGDSSTSRYTRRGGEKILFEATMVFAVLFVSTCLLAIVL